MPVKPKAVVYLVTAALLVLTACGGGNSSKPPQNATLSSISVSSSLGSVAAGLTMQLWATGTYSDGTTSDLTTSVTWTSSATDIATVGSSGLVTSKRKGQATITAAYSGITKTLQLTVTDPVLNSIAVTATNSSITLGTTIRLTATATYSDQTTQDVTSSVSWSSSDATIATVESGNGRGGFAAARGLGTVTITAASGTAQANVTLTVKAQKSRFAFTANYSDSTLSLFTVNNTNGQLTSKGYYALPPEILDPFHILVHPSGKYMYVSADYGIAAFAIDAVTGTPTPILGAFYPTQSVPSVMAFDPAGKHLYVPDEDKIYVFSVDDSTGTLSPVDGSPFANGEFSEFVAIDPTGRFLYSSDEDTNAITAFSIDPVTGALQPLQNSPFPAGHYPLGIAIDPSGKYLYVANSDDGTIGSYSIDPASGALSAINAIPTPNQPDMISVAPSGRVYFSNGTEIGSATVDLNTGALSSATSASASGTCLYLESDLSRNFLYAAEPDSDAVDIIGFQSNGDPEWRGSIRTREGPISINFVPGTEAFYVPSFLYAIGDGNPDLMFTLDPLSGAISTPVVVDLSSTPSDTTQTSSRRVLATAQFSKPAVQSAIKTAVHAPARKITSQKFNKLQRRSLLIGGEK